MQEAREERRAQEAPELRRSEREMSTQEQAGHESEVKAQEGHEGEEKAQGVQEEDANSLHEKCHVSNRHMTWWHNAWWIRVDNGPHMRSARGRRRTWRAARQAAEQVRNGSWVGETREGAEEAEGEKWKRKQRDRQPRQCNESTLHLVLHLPQNASASATTGVLKLKETVTMHQLLFSVVKVNGVCAMIGGKRVLMRGYCNVGNGCILTRCDPAARAVLMSLVVVVLSMCPPVEFIVSTTVTGVRSQYCALFTLLGLWSGLIGFVTENCTSSTCISCAKSLKPRSCLQPQVSSVALLWEFMSTIIPVVSSCPGAFGISATMC